ncbi:uncharacterized protein METZ01_LOCUS330234 [marine metagenome]|uniref:Uncharacterized protein n=1 Tax=marine metagenome TaxID=408172 RepID=A0A382PX79_9ZZZZ
MLIPFRGAVAGTVRHSDQTYIALLQVFIMGASEQGGNTPPVEIFHKNILIG